MVVGVPCSGMKRRIVCRVLHLFHRRFPILATGFHEEQIKFILNPGGTHDLNNALVIGARAVITFKVELMRSLHFIFICSKQSK